MVNITISLAYKEMHMLAKFPTIMHYERQL